ncbi:MAG: PAS domain-containing protein [Gaiellaceae bacterium]
MNVAQPLVQASLLGEAIDPGPALVFVADEEMRYVAVNQAACEALGYTREELLGLRVVDVAPDGEDDYSAMVSAGSASGRAELLRKDGSVLEIDYRASRTTAAQMTFYVSVAFPA